MSTQDYKYEADYVLPLEGFKLHDDTVNLEVTKFHFKTKTTNTLDILEYFKALTL